MGRSRMKLKKLAFAYVLYMTCGLAQAQTDFSVQWNFYTTDEIVTDDPFLGSFTIKNEGATAINAGDTLWYGYRIDGLAFDLELTPTLASGQVLAADFLPGDEIEITNTFYWPLWGSELTVEICAAIYGASISAFEVELFMGDSDTANNMDCVSAVLPTYEVSIPKNEISPVHFKVYKGLSDLIVFQNQMSLSENTVVGILNLNGQLVAEHILTLNYGENRLNLPELTTGIYLVRIQVGTDSHFYKVSF